MKKCLRNGISCLAFIFLSLNSFAQTLYNPKNVDRTAMSYFDGQQTFWALEYSTDPQGNNKVYRLQTLPENGFPGIILLGTESGISKYFEDKAPHDDLYTDNATPFLSVEAVQSHYGFQRVMKEFSQRFGWKGIDGAGVKSVNIYMVNTDETPDEPAIQASYINNDYFKFGRSLNGAKPFINTMEVIAHEFSHAIFYHRTGIVKDWQQLCSEYRTLNEGIADIFGIYIKNRILNTNPANYNWLFGEQIISNPKSMSNPKDYGWADTYNGQNYINVCTENYEPHPGSGIMHKWFYLLATGFQGSAYNDLGYGYSNLQGIGVEKAIQIVWNAIPALNANSDYPAFKTATLNAAAQLYGQNSSEYLATKNAWCAVGVCDNNLVSFSFTPANGASGVQPWPAVNVGFTWLDKTVLEWEVQMSTKFDFSENLQTVKVKNFTTVVNPNGGIAYSGTALGYYHPGDKVYARARITQADPNFCKGLNPLCVLYQQFGPAHAFTLDNKKAAFWSWAAGSNKINPWKDPILTWKSVNGAQKYTFQLANDKAFTNLVFTGTSNHTGNFTESGVINAALEAGKTYYTRVRAERLNSLSITNNFGTWSDMDSVLAFPPPTQVLQAKNQKAADPASIVSSMGFWVGWDPVPGAGSFVVQVATDNAFNNVIRQQIAQPNLTTVEVLLPVLADQTNLFVRVLPEKGSVYSACLNTWRIKTDENATKPAMTSPADGSPIAFKNYLGATFGWKGNSLNLNLVDHFELHLKEKTSGITTVYNSAGKAFDFHVKDQLMFDDKQGLEAWVRAVGPLGAKSALSAPFNYAICRDHPQPKFPSDFSKIDPSKSLTVTWDSSLWKEPSDNFLVTIANSAGPIAGFNNAPTMANSMVVPAGTLANNTFFELSIKNSAGCVGIDPPKVIFSTIAAGNNQPQPPVLKNFTVELHAFRNDADANFIPPAFETSDYVLGVELFDPNGAKVNVVDANGPVNQLLVDSENSILAMAATMQPVGKYTLKLKMLNIFTQLEYFPFDQPRFSVFLNGQSVLSNHIITFNPLDPASPFHEWQNNFQFADIILDVK